MICIDHLSFSFDQKLGFRDYCSNALNPAFKQVERYSLKKSVIKFYRDRKRGLTVLFANLNSRISIYSDIWFDQWQTHSYIGVTYH